MEKEELKTSILSAISGEIDEWLSASEEIKSGYEYEDQFLRRMRKVNKIILEKSMGSLPSNRNKKNSTPVWESLK